MYHINNYSGISNEASNLTFPSTFSNRVSQKQSFIDDPVSEEIKVILRPKRL